VFLAWLAALQRSYALSDWRGFGEMIDDYKHLSVTIANSAMRVTLNRPEIPTR